jgi:hypothetical protein
MGMAGLSMVVDEVNVEHLAVLEAENDAPIRSHGNCPTAAKFAFQHMQAEGREVHVFNALRDVEHAENVFDSFGVIRIDSSPVPILEQASQTFVPKAADHKWRVAR